VDDASTNQVITPSISLKNFPVSGVFLAYEAAILIGRLLAYFQQFSIIQQCDAKNSRKVLLQKCYKLLITHYFSPKIYNKNMISILRVSLV